MKALKVWAGRLFWLLYAAIILAGPLKNVLDSSDPFGTATGYAIPALVMLAVWIPLAFSFGFLQSRLSARAFEALTYTLAAALLFVVLVIWRATDRYGGGDGLVADDSWNAIATIARMDNPALVVAGLAAPVAGLYGLGGALYGAAHLVRTRLSGDARLAAYLGLAALVAFGVLVVMPALASRADGGAFIRPDLLTGLILWLGMVVPAIGVLIAYRRIGDGRS